jgi:hypothetical protein
VQQLDLELTLLGELEFVDRDVRLGTESESES